MSSAPSTPKGQIMPEFPSSPPNKIGMFSRRDSFLDDPPFGYASRDIDSDSSDSPPPLRRNGIFRRGLTYPPPRTPRGTAQAPPTPPNSNPSSQVLGTAFEFKPSRKRGHENGASSQSSSKRARIYFSPMASDDEGVDDEETCVKPERSPTPLVESYSSANFKIEKVDWEFGEATGALSAYVTLKHLVSGEIIFKRLAEVSD